MPFKRTQQPEILQVLETCLYVDDLDVAERFYRDILGLPLVSRHPERHVFFRCGNGMLLLFLARACQAPDSEVPSHGAIGECHVAFEIDADWLDAWKERLVAHGVDIEQTVQWPQGATSLYFRDPAGNSLEFATRRLWFPDEGASEDE